MAATVSTKRPAHMLNDPYDGGNNNAMRGGYDSHMGTKMQVGDGTAGPSFAEFLYQQSIMDSVTTGENPETNDTHYQSGRDIFFNTIADYALQHQLILPDRLFMYTFSRNQELFKMFPVRYIEGDTIEVQTLDMERHVLQPSVWKTGGQNIGMRVHTEQQHLVYRTQGFEFDWKAFQQPGGLQKFNDHYAALSNNLNATLIFTAAYQFRLKPTFYCRSDQLFPVEFRIRNPNDAFRATQLNFGYLNKTELGLEKMIEKVDLIMARESRQVGRMFLTQEDMDFLMTQDAGRLFNFVDGQRSATSRIGKSNKGVNIDFVIIPRVDEDIHNHIDPMISRSMVSTGTLAPFQDHTYGMDPAKFRSYMLDIEFVGNRTNNYDTYTLREVAHKDFHFQAVDTCGTNYMDDSNLRYTRKTGSDSRGEMMPLKTYYNQGASLPGHLNRELLRHFCSSLESLFPETRTTWAGNERFVDPYVRYEPSILDDEQTKENVGKLGAYFPIRFYGEKPECTTNTHDMESSYETAGEQLFKGLTKEQISHFEAGLALADELMELPVLFFPEGKSVKMDAYISYMEVDEFGSLPIAGKVTDEILQGRGNISGLFALNDAFKKYGADDKFKDRKKILEEFCPVYDRVLANALNCFSHHFALDHRMVFKHHNPSDKLSKLMCMRIAFWYQICKNAHPPVYSSRENPVTLSNAEITKDEVEDQSMRYNAYAKQLGVQTETVDNAVKILTDRKNFLQAKREALSTEDTEKLRNIVQLITIICSVKSESDTTVSAAITTATATLVKAIVQAITVYPLTSNAANQQRVSVAAFNIDNDSYQFRLVPSGMRFSPYTYKGMTLQDTLVGMLPFIHSSLPPLPRVQNLVENLSSKLYPSWLTDKKEFLPQIDLQFPLEYSRATNLEARHFDNLYHSQLYDEEAYRKTRFELADKSDPTRDLIPEAVLHLVFFPPSRNPFADNPSNYTLTDFDRRWILTHQYDTKKRIGARMILTSDITVQRRAQMYDMNIKAPEGATIIRPWETYDMQNNVFAVKGVIGNTYLEKSNKFLSFHTVYKQFQEQVDIRQAVHINNSKDFYIQPNTRGGQYRGGEGRLWFRDLFDIPPIVRSDNDLKSMRTAVGKGHEIGEYSNIAVAQGMSSTKEGRWHTDIDITGSYDQRDFVGVLTDCKEFHNDQDHLMYDGVLFVNYIHHFTDLRSPSRRDNTPLSKYNFNDQAAMRQSNTHCHINSIRHRNHLNHVVYSTNHHPWGVQGTGRGHADVKSSQGRIGYVTTDQ